MTRREFLPASLLSWAVSAQHKPRLRRSESFFGFHFDLHPSEEDTALGRDVTEEMVDRLLSRTKPDYVQYDSKGHVGWLGWPSKVGPSAPGIVKDSLAIWRKITARRGVSLYIHFSGVWDSEAVRRHPAWARRAPDGKPETRQTSVFGPYVDQLMIPQLREAATKYDLDGVWVDGDCWATYPDYSPMAAEAWKKATGKTILPVKGDADWLEFLEFNRAQFRRYVKHYADELHHSHPKFQVASNWLYSTLVPEEPTILVDFLSGDYLGNAAISNARLEGRYLAQTGKPWDLMAWGFQQADSNAIGHVHKPAAQLQQEAAVVLAQGGGFQIYYQPSRSGYFEQSHIEVMGKVADFCRTRQPYCQNTLGLANIAVLFSKESLYSTTDRLFGGWGRASSPASGWLDALVANQYAVDVLPDWKIQRDAVTRYQMVVVPEWTGIGAGTRDLLLDLAKDGLKLVVSGAQNAALFGPPAGIQLEDSPEQVETYLAGGEVLANVKGLWQKLRGGEPLENRYLGYDSTKPGITAAVSASVGRGEVLLIPGPIGGVYKATHAPAVRQFVERMVAPRVDPLVRVQSPPTVEVSVRSKGGATFIHLLNSTGMQVAGDYSAIDFVPTIGPVQLAVKLPARPAKVTLQPEGRALPFDMKDGRLMTAVDSLHIHSIVALTN